MTAEEAGDGREINANADGSVRVRFAWDQREPEQGVASSRFVRVLEHFMAHRLEGESFRQYVMRYRVETFRELTNEFAKPAELFPEIYQDWGDDEAYSLQLGRGE